MAWEVEYTDEFGDWWAQLTETQQDRIAAAVRLLEARGPSLPFPYSSGVRGSRHEHMRELRVQSRGNPLRIFYAFDPRRSAILLVGGDKTGDGFMNGMCRWRTHSTIPILKNSGLKA